MLYDAPNQPVEGVLDPSGQEAGVVGGARERADRVARRRVGRDRRVEDRVGDFFGSDGADAAVDQGSGVVEHRVEGLVGPGVVESLQLVGGALVEVGGHGTGRDHGDLDAVVRDFRAERLAHGLERELRARVDAVARRGEPARGTRHVHNPTDTPVAHVGQHRPDRRCGP